MKITINSQFGRSSTWLRCEFFLININEAKRKKKHQKKKNKNQKKIKC
jgi:hypothetical protein